MTGAATVGIWNLVSMPLEYVLTRDIYTRKPQLRTKQHSSVQDTTTATKSSGVAASVREYLRMWREYAKHPVFLLSFSFCALWMTILSGGSLSTAYLKWRGVPDSILGSSRGAGALFGLIGTFIFPTISKWIGRIERVAVVSVWLFWLSLVPVGVAFLVVGEFPYSDYAMIGCVIVSRMWLWSDNLAQTQVMQEWIEPDRRGAINAMQTATSQLFFIIIQFLGVVCHDPRQFEALVWCSLIGVLGTAVDTSVWDVRVGRHRELYVAAKPPTSSV